MNKYYKRKIKSFVEIIFLRNANKGHIVCIDLRESLCYLPNENNLYPVIPNNETNFIHNIQYFISSNEGIPLGRRKDLPKTLMGGSLSLSLSRVVGLTRVCELGGVCKF